VDVAPAYQRERDQIGEELAVDRRHGPIFLERTLKWLAVSGTSVFGVCVATATGLSLGAWLNLDIRHLLNSRVAGPWLERLFWATVASGMVGIPSSLAYLATLQRRTDVDSAFWAKIWRGPLGRLAFSIAKRSGGAKPAIAAMTHRATELSLGLAAEQLFESLPKASQKALGDLPAVLARLQKDAQALRARYESLQEALAGKVAADPEYDDLRTMRDEMHARLGDAVGSLETMRLGLLRLHAGSQTVEGLTTHLGIAAEVSAQVSRLVSAHQDVERSLRFPAQPAPTPV
jgi:hypothetical protein